MSPFAPRPARKCEIGAPAPIRGLRFRRREGKAPNIRGKLAMTFDERKSQENKKPQRLHLVFGGELKSLDSHEFRDVCDIDVVGLYPDYASAERAWRGKAQQTVDSAQTRYFIAHLHRLIEPDRTPTARIA
jgi:hypothetical protein